MIVCVSQAVPGPPGKVAWPYGGYGVNVDTSHGRVSGRGISMPNEWGDGSTFDQGNGRTIFETLTHEMGHTLGLPDEYKPNVAGRMLAGTPAGASWDPMEAEQPLPHFTIAHRMMLGWVQPTWVKLYNFLASGATVDETITLAAVEAGRRRQASSPESRSVSATGATTTSSTGGARRPRSATGNSSRTGDRRTDVSEPPDPPVISRPDILLLPKHGDDNGAVLDSGQFYHELDKTTPTYPSDFRFDVVRPQRQLRAGSGALRSDRQAGPFHQALATRPPHQWQSPDIEVQNARNAADSAWPNVPWQGHANTVVANIKNRGSLSAPGVYRELLREGLHRWRGARNVPRLRHPRHPARCDGSVHSRVEHPGARPTLGAAALLHHRPDKPLTRRRLRRLFRN